ncbi:hypothetical protein HLB44_28365 [Aquincola sp. S2]|uniref:Carboxypeptidase regulatory-like domain-containing protein n=1 Tax=Pseudaquabacterium terrae TaxID=2732868 RepID=A0ABX2EQL3_9BURK|nr:hypothetical protein [Aquabacterium terrae]NRF70926.1 hypothetical protein [Aquabacterium terrae]
MRTRQATQPAAAAASPAPTPTALFDWAELTYPELFPTHEADRVLGAYTYRYYPGQQNHVAVAGTQVFVQGTVSGGGLLYVGEIDSFACLVNPNGCTPAARSCAAVASWTVGANTCTPNAQQIGDVASGASVAYSDATGPTRGSASYTCNDGTLAPKGNPVCEPAEALACNTAGLSWTVAGTNCVVNAGEPAQVPSAAAHVFKASAQAVGSARYGCANGVLALLGTASCVPPPPVVCRPENVTWTAGGSVCAADSVPAQIGDGGSFTFSDATGTATGSATFTCSAGTLVRNNGAVCEPVTHLVDSFGGDGGAADGGASGDGTAGDGAPIVGALVQVADRNGRRTSATTDGQGYFRVKLTGFVPPLLVRVTRPDGIVRHSISIQPLKPNGYIFIAVTGLTDRIASEVANAAGFPGAAGLTPALIEAHPNAVAAAVSAIRNNAVIRQALIDAGLDPASFDPLATPFRANGSGHDRVLDRIVVTTDASGSTLINRADCDAPKSWAVAGVVCTPDTGEETVVPNGGTIVHRDTIAPGTGGVGWACLKGVLQPPLQPSCRR